MEPERPPTVVVIEDDDSLRRMVGIFLHAAGYLVRPAADAAEGLALVRTGPADAVLLDLVLPDLDGRAVLQLLKRNEATARIPVVVLTAAANALSPDQARRLGAARFMLKPVDVQALVDTLGQLLPCPAPRGAAR